MSATKDFKKFTDKLENELATLIGRAFTLELAKLARNLVYKRTKAGYGVNKLDGENIQQQKLKPLSDSYIKQRQGKVKFITKNGVVVPLVPGAKFQIKKPKLGEFGSPTRSNLTFTGEMLNAVTYELTRQGFTLVIPDSARSDGKTNAEIADLAQLERPFFSLTMQEVQILTREVERKLREIARRVNK